MAHKSSVMHIYRDFNKGLESVMLIHWKGMKRELPPTFYLCVGGVLAYLKDWFILRMLKVCGETIKVTPQVIHIRLLKPTNIEKIIEVPIERLVPV